MVEPASFISTKLELFISARDLQNKDTFSKSDPFCLVSLQPAGSTAYSDIDRTEVVQDNLNPDWQKTITMDFFFETKQSLKFSVFDFDESSPESLGYIFTTLGDLVAKGTSFIKLSTRGSLIIRVEEIKTSRDSYVLQMRGIKLDKKDTFGKSDPYLIFFRNLGKNQWKEVHRTEIIKKTLDPMWALFEVSEQQMCNCDMNKPIKIECYDWDAIGSHDLIGICETTMDTLKARGSRLELKNPKEKNKHSGTLEITDSIRKKHLSFIDYLRCGVQISLSIAIDFTGSNGEYSSSTSLHHIAPNNPNQYERAIWEVGNILAAYDSDRLFPVFGFGGVPRGEAKANHCFALNRDESNPYVGGVDGVLNLYRASLANVSLSGPTLFHHLIDKTISVASSTPPHTNYYVLLILTDGAIMDMPETIRSIVQASSLPLSIIIVGVGNAEFDSMESLDCDKGFLSDDRGRKAVRDIVQFVPFRQFGGNPIALAAEVLKEVPKQLTDFMKTINYIPELPEERPISELERPIIQAPPVVVQQAYIENRVEENVIHEHNEVIENRFEEHVVIEIIPSAPPAEEDP